MKMDWTKFCCIFAVVCSLFTISYAVQTEYNIGIGIADVTGPAYQVNMMGYGEMGQKTAGIHMRLFSRAYIVADKQKQNRVAFVSVDMGMVSTIIKLEVVRQLKAKYGNLYTEANVLLSATHTHSGVGGYHQYILYAFTSIGFVKESFDAIVNGIVKSIKNAHNSMKPGNIHINEGDLFGAGINRSPLSYLRNPTEEKTKYVSNIDTLMTLLKFTDKNGKDMGMINWFATHPTSLKVTNRLISGDNKGYASYLFERTKNLDSLPGKGSFVAAFANSNMGDVSPNTKGSKCEKSGKACDLLHSTCPSNEKCLSYGPGVDMYDSMRIIGKKQSDKALELYDDADTPVTGPIDFRHQYVDMSNVDVELSSTETVKTCRPAMGYSFAAGTPDGPGPGFFKQGDTKGNVFWNAVRPLLCSSPSSQIKCQAPKPILLDTGCKVFGITLQPSIVPLQLIRIGQLVIIAVPGEFTTMAGRRLRETIKKTLTSNGFPSNTKVVITGLANTYSSYVTTYEEYQVQRYEAASTIFGPHTLSAYIQKFKVLAKAMAKGTTVQKGPSPPNRLRHLLDFLPPVVFDCHPWFKKFGYVLTNAKREYKKGSTVKVTFVSATPRNNLKTGSTYLKVERKQNKTWKVLYTDANEETRFYYIRKNAIDCKSSARITWEIPADQQTGQYRIRHFGNYKPFLGKIKSFTGTSRTFKVVN